MNTRTKHNRALFIAATVLFWFSQYVYIPNFTSYLTSFLVMPASTAGMIIGAYGLTQALLRVPVGLVGVKADHSRHVMLIGCACLVLSSTLLSFFKSGIVLWLSRALAGVGAASWVCFTVYYSSNFSRSTEHNMGAMVIANNLGMFLAYSTSAALSDMSGISALFGLSTAAAFASVALLCILFSMCGKVVEAPPAAISAGFLDILRNRKIWMCASFTALSQFVSFATYDIVFCKLRRIHWLLRNANRVYINCKHCCWYCSSSYHCRQTCGRHSWRAACHHRFRMFISVLCTSAQMRKLCRSTGASIYRWPRQKSYHDLTNV